MNTFRQFTKWYVETLDDDEVLEILELLRKAFRGGPDEHQELSSTRMRAILVKYWNHREAGIEVSRFLEESRHAQAAEDIRNKTMTEIEESRDELLETHGLQGLAFALVVNPDEFKRGIGFQLIEEYGDRLAEFPGPPALRDKVNAQSEPTMDVPAVQEPDLGPVQLVNRAVELLEQDYITVDIGKMDKELERLTRAWASHKDKYFEKGKALVAISGVLSPKFEDELRFQEVLNLIPMQMETYRHLAAADLMTIAALLSDLDDLCSEASVLKMQAPSNMTERRKIDAQMNHLNQEIVSKATAVGAFFKESNTSMLSKEEEHEKEPSVSDQTEVPLASDPKPSMDKPQQSIPKQPDAKTHTEAREQVPPAESPLPADRDSRSESYRKDTKKSSSIQTKTPVDHPTASPPRDDGLADSIDREAKIPSPDTALADQDSPNAASNTIWQVVAQGDFATAYWLVKEQGPLRGMLPDWSLLALVLGSTADWTRGDAKIAWYEEVGMPHSKPLQEIMVSADISPRAAVFAALAAALRPAVLAPETAAYDWIKDASNYLKSGDPLKHLSDTIFEFAHQGEPLNLGTMTEAGREAFLQDAERAGEAVDKWMSDASAARLMYPHTTRVLGHLASDNGPLADALHLVRGSVSSQKDIPKVEEVLNGPLRDRQSMESLIHDTNQSLAHSGPRVPAIHSKALEQLVRKLEGLKRELEDWVHAAKHGFASENYDWQVERSREFRERFFLYWPELDHELKALGQGINGESTSQLEREMAICMAAHNMLKDFACQTLGGETPLNAVSTDALHHWQVKLGRPLWRLSLPPVDPEGRPLDLDGEFQPREPFIDVVRAGRTLEDAFGLHMENNDFLAANLILGEMERCGMPDVDSLAGQYRQKLSETQIVLKDRTMEIRRELEQATIDHVLSDDTRSHLDGVLLSIEEMETQRLTSGFTELSRIKEELERLRQERIRSLREWIDGLSAELEAEDNDGLTDITTAAKYVSLAHQALDRGDIPLADEYLHYGEQAQAGVEVELEGQHKQITAPMEFTRVLERINQALETGNNPRALANQLAQGQSVAGLNMRAVPGARYREIRDGLQAWFQLKRTGGSGNKDRAVRAMLTYMGFQEPEIRLVDQTVSVPRSYYYQARMSAGNLSPLADFGSARNGLYHAVVIYGRPSAESMGLALQHYDVISASPIILFMGRMPLRQREEWSEYCRNHSITALLIDELLAHFLATQRESRLPAAVSCGVAWGYAVPYQASGVIPPEIFKGRHILVHDLADTNGRLIVYGGRQFGKSALLRMVERQYHNPARNFYVLYDDIRQIGHPENMLHPSSVWPRLRSWLISIDLLPTRVSEEPETLAREIIEAMNKEEHRTWRIIVLLDEADNFLTEDSKSDFPELGRLKSVMDQTDMRFKVILSGLHGVQRFYSHENHPFAQLRQPIVIGPLEPRAAQQLVIEPMSALGFDFSGPEQMTAVLRILCYTNYHPALIQGFCQELVKLVRLRNDSPPYKVTLSHVEAVYRRPEVRRQMQERFEWTLDLDNRYTAIVYSMILDQLQDYDGYRREYFAHEILQLLREFWPKRFDTMEAQEAKTLVDELIGLGVLVRRANGKYRLRNGNVVRALGSYDEILDRALKLDERLSEPAKTGRQLRFSLDVEKGIRSPLTVEQISNLSQARSGVALIFGSEALGINLVHDSLNAAAQAQAATHIRMVYEKTPPEYVTSEQMLHYLRGKIHNKRAGRHLLHWSIDDLANDERLVQSVDEAISMLSRLQGRGRSIRLVVTLGPKAMCTWFMHSSQSRLEVESRADMLIEIGRWDSYMIERFYQDFDVKAPTRDILKVTGGWPWLIQKLNLMAGEIRGEWDADTLRKATDQLQYMLEQNQDSLRDEFRGVLGVSEFPTTNAILRLVKQWEGLTCDELVYAASQQDKHALGAWPRERITGVVEMLVRLGLLEVTSNVLTVEPVSAGAVVGHA